MHPTTTQRTAIGRFDSAEVVRARRQFDEPFTPSAVDLRSAALTGAAEVCAARRRFDGALGREGSGGAESFQPRFTGARVADEPLLVIDLESGSGTLADRAAGLLGRIDDERGGVVRPRAVPERTAAPRRRISQVTPPPPLMPSGFDVARTPAPPISPPTAAVTPVVVGPKQPPMVVSTDEIEGFAGAVAKLRTLGALRNEGLITDAEYDRKRAVFLDLL